jgi:hypothetical protein
MVRWPLLAAALLGSAAMAADTPSAARGRQVFDGDAALSARIVGQDFALPAEASRCINCHGTRSSAASVQRIGPALTLPALTELQHRRGGPPSRYDAASLCTLLRSGVDPAYVIILRTMPRYEVTDTDCHSLWLHLTAPSQR